ncbi:hypothetical protein PMAYCL1PPCAC_09751, partial [Pristionchus mayeri]
HSLIMRVTCPLRVIIRSRGNALEDINTTKSIMKRYGIAQLDDHPRDAMSFRISLTPDPTITHPGTTRGRYMSLFCIRGYPRMVLDQPRSVFWKKYSTHIGWWLHRRSYSKMPVAVANQEVIANITQKTFKNILSAMRHKNLSSLAPLLLDDGILRGIERRSELSSLTKRQLRALEVSDDDFIGIDGIVNTWNRIQGAEDDPAVLLRSIRSEKSEMHNKPLMIYSVDVTAIRRKDILMPKNSCLPPPTEIIHKPPPKAYGFPSARQVYGILEFAHLGTADGKFSDESFLHNFHVYSF